VIVVGVFVASVSALIARLCAVLVGVAFLAWRARRVRRVRLVADNSGVEITNPWRTLAVAWDDVEEIDLVLPWWCWLIIGSLTSSCMGFRIRGRRLGVPAVATVGMTIADEPIIRLEALRAAAIANTAEENTPES
jgi:hypothetical protein